MYVNVVLNHFWKWWQLEYLLDLRESHRQQCAGSNGEGATTVKIGDIVLLQEDKPHAFWRLARVKQLITGCDGRVRAAIPAVPLGDRQTCIFQRPIQLLYALETDVQISSGNQVIKAVQAVVQTTQPAKEHPEETQVRPRRAAALNASQRLSELDY